MPFHLKGNCLQALLRKYMTTTFEIIIDRGNPALSSRFSDIYFPWNSFHQDMTHWRPNCTNIVGRYKAKKLYKCIKKRHRQRRPLLSTNIYVAPTANGKWNLRRRQKVDVERNGVLEKWILPFSLFRLLVEGQHDKVCSQLFVNLFKTEN